MKGELMIMRLLKCPNCEYESFTVCRNADPKHFGYHVSCDNCHWVGKTRITKGWAKIAWNRTAKKQQKVEGTESAIQRWETIS